jgi:hypothetical protein
MPNFGDIDFTGSDTGSWPNETWATSIGVMSLDRKPASFRGHTFVTTSGTNGGSAEGIR